MPTLAYPLTKEAVRLLRSARSVTVRTLANSRTILGVNVEYEPGARFRVPTRDESIIGVDVSPGFQGFVELAVEIVVDDAKVTDYGASRYGDESDDWQPRLHRDTVARCDEDDAVLSAHVNSRWVDDPMRWYLRRLKAGDGITATWVLGNNSTMLRERRLTQDECLLQTVRNRSAAAGPEVVDSVVAEHYVGPDNTARLLRTW